MVRRSVNSYSLVLGRPFARVDQIIDNSIELNPEYQRGPTLNSLFHSQCAHMYAFSDIVWPESKQSGLIDSILRNYYIPPVIFCEYSIHI